MTAARRCNSRSRAALQGFRAARRRIGGTGGCRGWVRQLMPATQQGGQRALGSALGCEGAPAERTTAAALCLPHLTLESLSLDVPPPLRAGGLALFCCDSLRGQPAGGPAGGKGTCLSSPTTTNGHPAPARHSANRLHAPMLTNPAPPPSRPLSPRSVASHHQPTESPSPSTPPLVAAASGAAGGANGHPAPANRLHAPMLNSPALPLSPALLSPALLQVRDRPPSDRVPPTPPRVAAASSSRSAGGTALA